MTREAGHIGRCGFSTRVTSLNSWRLLAFTFFGVVLFLVVFTGCGPSESEVREQQRREQEQRLEQAEAEAAEARAQAEEARVQIVEAQHRAEITSGILVLLVCVAGVAIGVAWHFRKTHVLVQEKVVERPVVKEKVVEKIVHEPIIYRTPAHDIDAHSFAIDGLNVAFGSAQGQPPSLLNVLGLLIELQSRGDSIKCFFDANTYYKFSNAGLPDDATTYRLLSKKFPDVFIEVPSRTRADEFILDCAHRQGATIISNDRFRGYAVKYPWLDSDGERRLPFILYSGELQIPPLGVYAALPASLDQGVSSLSSLLNGR